MTKYPRRLILHAGMPKTGSSALQVFFAQNAAALAARGITYPATQSVANALKGEVTAGNAGHFTRALRALPKPALDGEPLAEALRAAASGRAARAAGRLIRRFSGHMPGPVAGDASLMRILREAAHAPGDVLLSSELFWTMPAPRLRAAAALFAGLGLRPLIIVYVRDQIALAGAGYAQAVMQQGETGTIEAYAARRDMPLDFDAGIARWAGVFGDEAIRVRPYLRQAWPGGSIEQDFMQTAGIGWHERFVLPDAPVNPTPSLPLLMLVRDLNASDREAADAAIAAFRARAPDAPALTADRETSIVPPALQRTLAARYAVGNSRVAERHFPEHVPFRPQLRPAHPRLAGPAELSSGERGELTTLLFGGGRT